MSGLDEVTSKLVEYDHNGQRRSEAGIQLFYASQVRQVMGKVITHSPSLESF